MVIRRKKSTRSWERTSHFGTRENRPDSISHLPSRSPESPRNCRGRELSCLFKLFGSLMGEELAGCRGGRGEQEKRKAPLYSPSSPPEPAEGLLQDGQRPRLLRRETSDTCLQRLRLQLRGWMGALGTGVGGTRHPQKGPPCLPDLPQASSLAAVSPGLRKHPPDKGSWGRALVSWLSVDLGGSFQNSERSRLCLSMSTSGGPPPPSGDTAFLLRGMGSQREQGPGATHGNGPLEEQGGTDALPGSLCQHHPSLAATSCPMPSRM